MTAKRMKSKRADQWTGEDFIAESARIAGDEDLTSDAVMCGAMMLAALREGAHLDKIGRLLNVETSRLEWMFENLRKSKVFTDDGKVSCGWFEKDGGIAFNMDVCVGLGLMERSA